MRQMHRRLGDEQVRFVLQKYDAGALSRGSAQGVLGVGKTRFFALLHAYRQDPDGFSIAYQRSSPDRLPSEVEEAMRRELLRDRALIEDPELPITDYNYSALRDRLRREGITVSLTTVIARAKSLGCYRHRPRRKAHDRQVLTNSIGSLVQHDASTHRWSPYADAKWTLIASLDDYSRKLLYAKFVPQETTWAHIEAVRSLVQSYGLPLAYYVDSLRVFRFVQHRDSVWRRQVLGNDEADPQWKQVMQLLGINVVYALSPQAKGKIERPFSAGFRIASCAPAPWSRSPLWTPHSKCSNGKSNATTATSAIPPPANSPTSASRRPSPQETPCSVPSACLYPIRPPKMSSVSARPASPTAIDTSHWPTRISLCPGHSPIRRSTSTSSRMLPDKLCRSAGGRTTSSSAQPRFR